jgi:hypothetical protein
MGTIRKSTIIIALLVLIFLIGSALLGVRFGRSFLEKKLLAVVNTRILKNFSGELAWKNVSFDFFQSTVTFEDVSFSRGKNILFIPLSARKVQVRYSLVKLLSSGRLFFPRIRLEGLQGKWTAPDGTALQGSTLGVPIPSNEEIVQRTLSKARVFLRKVDVLDGDWEIEFPAMGRKIHFQQIEFHSDLSTRDSLMVQASIPRIRVIGPSQDNYFADEYFSLPKAAFCLAKDSLRFNSLSLSTSSKSSKGSKGEEIELQGDILHPFSEFPSLALSYQGRVNWNRLKHWYPHLSFQGSPLITSGKIGGSVGNPMVNGVMHVEEVRFYPAGRGKELSGNANHANQPCFTASHFKFYYLYTKDRIALSQVSFSTPGKVSGQAEFFFPDQRFSVSASADGLELPSVINYLLSVSSEKTENFKLKADNFLYKIQSMIQKEYPIGGGKVSFQGRLLQKNTLQKMPLQKSSLKKMPLQKTSLQKMPLQKSSLQNCQPTLIGSGEFDVRLSGPSKKDPLSWKAKFSLPGGEKIRVYNSDLKLAGNSLSFHGDLNYSGSENVAENVNKTVSGNSPESSNKSSPENSNRNSRENSRENPHKNPHKNLHKNSPENFKDIGFDVRLGNITGLSALWPAIKSHEAGGRISFTGTLAGSFSDPLISGSLTWQDAAFLRFSAQKVEGMVRYSQKSIFLSNIHLQHNQTSVTVEGKISALTGQGDLHAEADPIYYDDLEQILELRAPVLIKGRMACQSDFQILPGGQQKFLGHGQVTTGEWSIADKRHPSLKQHFDSVTSGFEVDGAKFQLDHTIGNLGRQKVSAELIFIYHHAVPNLYQFSSEDFNLSNLDPVQEQKIPLGGKSSFQILGKGGIGFGDWDWKIKVHHPQYEGFSLDQLITSVQMQGKEYRGEVTAGKNKFSVQGNMEKGVFYQLAGQIPQLEVEQDLSYLRGMLNNKIPYQQISYEAPNQKTPYQKTLYQSPNQEAPDQWKNSVSSVSKDNALKDNASKDNASKDNASKDNASKSSVSKNNASKDSVSKDNVEDNILKGKVYIELSGQVRASGYLNNFEQSTGEFLANKATINTPLQTLYARQPFTITYDQGRVFISDSHFTGEGVEARLRGEASRDRQLDFSFSGVVPMTYLGQKCPLLSGSTGNMHFGLSLEGKPGSLKFSTRLRAVDCSFDLPQLNRRIEDIQGDFLIDEKSVTITSLTGKCHEGNLAVAGKLNLTNFHITSVDLGLKGENILLASPAQYKFLLNGDLRLQGSKEHSDLTGAIDVREGRYHRDVGILQSFLTRQRKIDLGEKVLSDFPLSDTEWLNNTSYNVRVNIPQNVWIKSSFFTAEIAKTEFFIRGNFSHPYLEGRVRTINGAILLGGNKFQIISGLLDLTDPEREDISLDILASADIDVYRITANIFGSVDDPQIRLSSTPYLSQTDILNMTALGISSDGGTGGELTGQSDLEKPLVSDIFGKEVTSFSGIDLFRAKVLNRDLFRVDLFNFKVGEGSGAVEKITVGRDITNRLQLKYSIPAGVEKREIAEADYKLSDYIKLIGSQDDLGTYSVDLNFSFDF